MRLRLHIKFALWLLLVGILPLAIMGGYSMVKVRRTVEETTIRAHLSLAEEMANEVNRIIHNGTNSVYYLAENLTLASSSTATGQLEGELKKTQRFHPIIKDITLLDRNGNIKASALYSFRGSWAATSWYQQAVRGSRVFTGVHSVLYPFDIVMTTAAPVYESKSGKMTGVLVSQLSMEPIWQLFSDRQLGKGSRALLLDNNGRIVASALKNEILNPAPDQLLSLIGGGGSGSAHMQHGERKELMVYAPLRNDEKSHTNNWHVIITQPAEYAYAASASVWRGLLLAAAVSFVAVAVISTILSRHINVRIRPLINATRSLGKGEFPLQLKGLGSDEIGELGKAFMNTSAELARTSEEVRNYQTTLEELVETRTRALQKSNEELQQQIEERIRMEEERRTIEELFRQSQKMEAVGTLAGGIAHDFNNILQIINGQVQILILQKDRSDPDVATLTEITRVVSRAAELVRRLLTFSRKMETAPQRMNLNTMVASAVRLLSRTIPKMISIETHLDEDLCEVLADYNQMEQVLMNLTSNCADAMPDGGLLKITTENRTVDAVEGKFLELEPGPYVVLSVTDTGIGMDEAVKKRIFEPFFTSKEIGKGTGLGLSTVYGIVQDHNGYISCDSEPGAGTQFYIYLPVAEGEAVAESSKDSKEDDYTALGGLETILVVDDEAIVREIAEDMISRFGYKVYLCENGERALEKYEELRDQIDLVITDIGMPGMGGGKLAEKLLKFDPQVKIIVASGYANSAIENGKADLREVKAFIQKPYQLKLMLKTIRQVLDG